MNEKLRNAFKDALREENLKLTPQREKIFETVANTDQHWEVDDLTYLFHQEHERISRATIYRTLDILVDHGFMRKVDFGEGRYRYEYVAGQDHHDHMICEECGEIIEFVDDKIESRQDVVCDELGFKPSKHVLQIYGLCEKCQAKNGRVNDQDK